MGESLPSLGGLDEPAAEPVGGGALRGAEVMGMHRGIIKRQKR